MNRIRKPLSNVLVTELLLKYVIDCIGKDVDVILMHINSILLLSRSCCVVL